MRARSKQRRNERGFTLLELLLAIVLLALLTGMLAGGFRMVARNQERATAPLDRAERIAAVYGFLRGQLADAQPAPPSASRAVSGAPASGAPASGAPVQADRQVPFEGFAEGIRFVGPPAASLAIGGLQQLTVGFAGGRLAVRWRLYRSDIPEPGGESALYAGDRASAASVDFHRDAVLLDHVADAQFAYFGNLDTDDLPAWHQTWLETGRLPLLVRMSVVFDDGHRPPDLLVALRLAAAPAAREPEAQDSAAPTPPVRRRNRRE